LLRAGVQVQRFGVTAGLLGGASLLDQLTGLGGLLLGTDLVELSGGLEFLLRGHGLRGCCRLGGRRRRGLHDGGRRCGFARGCG
jgi:hypothetical protein